MSSRPIVRHPDFTKGFVLQTDASSTSISGVLTQFEMVPSETADSARNKRAAGGAQAGEYVVGYYSKLCSPREARMSQVELEAFAVVQSLLHFRTFLWGRPITVVTDAQALCWLMNLKDGNGKLMRWAIRIQEFDVMIQHRAGKMNNADALSRLAQQKELDRDEPMPDADEQWPEQLGSADAPPSGVTFAPDALTVGVMGGIYILPEHGTPFRFNDWMIGSEARITSAPTALTIAGIREAAFESEESDQQEEELTREYTQELCGDLQLVDPNYKAFDLGLSSFPQLDTTAHLQRLALLSVPAFKDERALNPNQCMLCKLHFATTREAHDKLCPLRAQYDLLRDCPKKHAREEAGVGQANVAPVQAALSTPCAFDMFVDKVMAPRPTRALVYCYTTEWVEETDDDESGDEARIAAAVTRGSSKRALPSMGTNKDSINFSERSESDSGHTPATPFKVAQRKHASFAYKKGGPYKLAKSLDPHIDPCVVRIDCTFKKGEGTRNGSN